MDGLEEQLNSLNISGETGVLYDLEQLKHKSVRQHVECPARLQSIFNHLTSQELLKSPLVHVVDKLKPADKSIIQYVHDDKYIEFIEGMWPEETKKKEIYLLDTYINESSKHAAYLGTGAVVESIDRIMKKQWKNAFCIIRPPGHHSGQSKVCTGFCFFNNVAIAARYLQKNHGVKKVLIFDWDVHHGDGTQHIFKDDPSVLFVSLHRHDDGSFYPQSGAASNNGTGEGKGYSVNIPWDVGYSPNALTAGTDEYIYAFERIAMPIIQEFQPEFILISAGFDSAEGDPLGQCKVTYEGYAYMTRRLMEVTNNSNLLVCLEGGYNLDSISWAAESVLRTLTGEKFPLEKAARKFTLQEMKDRIQPNVVGFNAVRLCLEEYGKYWKSLGEFGSQYDQLMIKNVTETSQISAGHESNFLIRGNQIWKKCKKNEIAFYKDLNNPDSKFREQNERLKKFIPNLIGIENYNNSEYVVLENLNYGRTKGSIIDLKLGRTTLHSSYSVEKSKAADKKDQKSTSALQGYRLSGAIFKNDLGIPAELLKKGAYLTCLSFKEVQEYIKKVFSSNTPKFDQINPVPLQEFIQYLEELLDFHENVNTRQFIASSIMVIVDNTNNSYAFKYIDFNYVGDLPEGVKRDENVVFGIKNLIEVTKKIYTVATTIKKKK